MVWSGGKRDSSGLDVMWKEMLVKSMLLYIRIWCQHTRLSMMYYSPDDNTCIADFAQVGHLFHLSSVGIKVT